jgi:hypothetical protein
MRSPFVHRNVPRLLRRYDLSYQIEGDCVEYFILDKASATQISYAIVFSLNRVSREIHVSRFYPELYKELRSKYLSAACFYLLIHHFCNLYHLGEGYTITLETRPDTFELFFSKLRDFDLRHVGLKLCESVSVAGDYHPLDVDTSVIKKETAEDGSLLFGVW